MSKRWKVSQIETNPELADINKSTILLTINPNQVSEEKSELFMREVIDYMLDNLNKIVYLSQHKERMDYDALAEVLIGDIAVGVKYEVGGRFSRLHTHIKVSATMRGKDSKMFLDAPKIRAYMSEQFGYPVYVNCDEVSNADFNVDRYISK